MPRCMVGSLGRGKADAQLGAIPVVAFTTCAVEDDVLAGLGSHANAYVTKPIDLDTFQRVVLQVHRLYALVDVLPRRARADDHVG